MITFRNCNWKLATSIAILGAVFSTINTAKAQQVVPDNTLPNNSVVNNLENNITNITGGTQRGGNLFHSFERFGVDTGGEVNFLDTGNINNIINRVTGGNISNIDGLIRANGSANLFLINPNGIVFGENARLDIGGSFIGSTADALGFGEDNFFSATDPQNSSELLSINPNALFFNQLNPQGSIENRSVAPLGLNPSDEYTALGLRVPDGKSLLLVGGDINMDAGGLVALGGRVEIGGLAGTGTVGLNGDGNNFSLSFTGDVERSNVSLTNGAGVRVSAGDGGFIAVNARNLEITGESFFVAGIASGQGFGNSNVGNIDINATGTIALQNDSRIDNQVKPEASGEAGDVNIIANTLQVESGSWVSVSTRGAGKAGNLTVNAQNVQLNRGEAGITGLFAEVFDENSTGNAGDLTVNTNTLFVENGARVSVDTFTGGKGGNLRVNAQDVRVIGESANNQSSRLSARSNSNSTEDAGDLTINTNTLLVRDGAQVSASTRGEGNGGNLTVNAQTIELIGTTADDDSPSGLFTSAEGNSTGDAGNLSVETNSLLLQNGAQVFTGTSGSGNGGNLTVNAQTIELIGESNNGRSSGLFASTQEDSLGNAGDLTVNTNTLLVRDGAEVAADTRGEGKGGNLTVEAQTIELIRDGASSTGLFARARTNSKGDAGNLSVETNSLLLRDGAVVSASTFGEGNGGNLTVNAQTIELIGTTADDDDFSSGLLTSAQRNSTGNAGNLSIETNSLLVQNGAQVFTGTFGSGNGGNLTVNAQTIELIGESNNGRDSGLFASTQRNSTGNAGDLTVNTNTLLVRDGAQVAADTRGEGKGGNLTVDAQTIELIRGGASTTGLFARARTNSKGDAGNLSVDTNTLLVRDGAQVSASTFGEGNGGNLTVNAQTIELIGTTADDDDFPSGLFTSAEGNSTGNAGNLSVETNSLLLENGAEVSASTFAGGNGGNLNITAQDIQLIGSGSGLFAQADVGSTGNAGDLTINTNMLALQDGAEVSASTFGAGNSGNLTITAQDIQLIGSGSGLFANANSGSTGDAGDLTINTNMLALQDGAEVSASTFGGGNSGNLTITAQDIQLIGGEEAGASGLFAQANSESTGNAGDLNIITNTLLVEDGADVSASTFASGSGGNLTIEAQTIELIGSEARSTGLFARAESESTGDAGDLTINTNMLALQDGAQVSASTFGGGNGGNLNITAQDIQLIGGEAGLTGLFAQADVDSTGDAGDLTITTDTLQVENEARISVGNLNQGVAGNLTINADSIRLNKEGLITADTRSNQSNSRTEQATININSRGLILRNGSKITADATNSNVTGGNINIDSGVIAAFENSDITANSAEGRGGDITIETQGLFGTQVREEPTDFSDITATGANELLFGNIEINGIVQNPVETLTELPTAPVEGEFYDACQVGVGENASEFYFVGTGGIPPSPLDLLQEESVDVGWVSLPSELEGGEGVEGVEGVEGGRVSSQNPKPKVQNRIVEATGMIVDENGDIFFVAQASPQSAPSFNNASCVKR